MAKYAISREGIESLQALAAELNNSTNSIDDASKTLYTAISALDEGLGVFQKDIYVLLKEVINTNNRGNLCKRLQQRSTNSQLMWRHLLVQDFNEKWR